MTNTKKDQKKWKKIRIIGAIALLALGTGFGFVAMYMSGWDFVKFISNPTTILVALVVVAIAILMISWKEPK